RDWSSDVCSSDLSKRLAADVHDHHVRAAWEEVASEVACSMTGNGTRIAALWFPDWPIQAAHIEKPELKGPIILARHHRVEVCNHSARTADVKRAMWLRQAQAICSEATVVEANEVRDRALFAASASSSDDVVSSVQVLRSGLVIVDARAALRFHGQGAMEMLLDGVS